MNDRAVFRARVVLLLYLAFSAFVLGFDFWSRSRRDVRELVVPLTGWTGLSTYGWTFFFATFAIFHTHRSGMSPLLFMLGSSTILEAVMTFLKAVEAWRGVPDFGNPYLTYHPLQPLVTVVPLAAWFVLLWWARRGLPPSPSASEAICGVDVASDVPSTPSERSTSVEPP